jgi:predicted anti-sigma-YlaC factor YlaD
MRYLACILISLMVLSSGCIKRYAVNKTANALSGAESLVFSGDEDPELVGDALPFALKMYESLLEKTPRHVPLLISTGKSFVMYSFAFVQTPADQMTEEQLALQHSERMRAKKLYLRARGYLFTALNECHPGFDSLIERGTIDSALALTDQSDTTALYWTGMAWMAAITADKKDIDLVITMPRAVAFVSRVKELNANFGEGSVDEFFLSYYGGLPASMGGSEEKARECFKKAIELSKGKKAGPYLSLATTVSIRNQNIKEFRDLLNKALAVDVSHRDKYRLTNVIYQKKAQWYLDNEDNYFLSTDTLSTDTITTAK